MEVECAAWDDEPDGEEVAAGGVHKIQDDCRAMQLPPAGQTGYPVCGEGSVPLDVEADRKSLGDVETNRSLP